jgi:hypothetical protein
MTMDLEDSRAQLLSQLGVYLTKHQESTMLSVGNATTGTAACARVFRTSLATRLTVAARLP